MEWLEPWGPTDKLGASYHENFVRQLHTELPRGHELFGLPVKLIGRGNGDDALFEIADGSSRVAVVHLTWAKHTERLPFPLTTIYKDLGDFINSRMLPENRDWADE